jgi:hypothetical protein
MMPFLRIMVADAAMRWLMLASLVGLGAMLLFEGPADLAAICGRLSLSDIAELPRLGDPGWTPLAPGAEWMAMVVAMMSPLLSMPMRQVWHARLRTDRLRGIAMFSIGHAAGWLPLGLVLVPMAMALRLVAGDASAFLALGGAIAWSCSPMAQTARRACHRMDRIGVFGVRADMDCLRYGARVATDCCISAWPWMLVPMLTGNLHVASTAAVGVILFLETMAPAGRSGWRNPPILEVVSWFVVPQKVLGRE